MKVTILGGCGSIGSSAARDLIKCDEVSQVILASRKPDLSRVHQSLRTSKKVATQAVDVTDSQALINVIKGNDFVVNCIGPFYKFALPIMRAVIGAGVNYVDVLDDGDATQQAFGLDDMAKRSGVLLAIGFGGSPGTTNMLSKYAADKLDDVEDIRILWVEGLSSARGLSFGEIAHGLHCFAGGPQYIDGKLVNVPAGSGREKVKLSRVDDECELCYFSHGEQVSLPRYIKGVRTVVNKGGFLPIWASQILQQLAELGFARTEPLQINDAVMVPADLTAMIIQNSPSIKTRLEADRYTTSSTDVIVKGKKEGKSMIYTYSVTGDTSAGTGISASIGVQLLSRQDTKKTGVIAAEGCVDPKAYFAEFSQRGFKVVETVTVAEEKALL